MSHSSQNMCGAVLKKILETKKIITARFISANINIVGSSNCVCGQWQNWNPCNVTCGAGSEIRRRTCPSGCGHMSTTMTKPCQGSSCSEL